MTYHIISLLNEGAYLSVDLGSLVCRYKNGEERRIPLDDVRGVICAAPGIAFSNAALAKLLANDVVLLHCDRHYKPVGWSLPLDRVVRGTVFLNQIQATDPFKQDLWRAISLAKMRNQAQLLTRLGVPHELERLIERPLPSEANVARAYWRPYLTHLGAEFGKRERQAASSFENKALNYGYAVLATLVHRAALMYGLLPSLGVHHRFRFRSAPLVYDLMEPQRGIVDLLLADWRLQQRIQQLNWQAMGEAESEALFKDWVQTLMNGLRTYRLAPKGGKHTLKWMDAADKSVRSVARCFETLSLKPLWTPCLSETYRHTGEVLEEEAEEEEDTV